MKLLKGDLVSMTAAHACTVCKEWPGSFVDGL